MHGAYSLLPMLIVGLRNSGMLSRSVFEKLEDSQHLLTASTMTSMSFGV
jgi:hypothetical protein